MNKEDQYWLDVTNYEDYERRFFDDPTISTEETVEAIVASFPKDPRSILEIGCGYGRLTTRVKGKYPDAFVTGIDINPKILELADTYSGWRFDKENTTKYPFYYNTDKFPLNKKMDAIYSVTVFQHLPNEKKQDYILRAGQALKKGGVLVIQFIEGDRDNFIDHWVSREKMKEWFEEAGLKIIKEEILAHPQWVWFTGRK